MEPREHTTHGTSERSQRARRARRARRQALLADKVIAGMLLAFGIGACLVFVDSMDIGNEKALAGWTVAAIVFPTVVLFLVYDPLTKMLRGKRRR